MSGENTSEDLLLLKATSEQDDDFNQKGKDTLQAKLGWYLCGFFRGSRMFSCLSRARECMYDAAVCDVRCEVLYVAQ